MHLIDSLASAGWAQSPADFDDLMADLFHDMWHDRSTEDLLHNPTEAVLFCEAVRKRARVKGLHESVILRRLIGIRKHAR